MTWDFKSVVKPKTTTGITAAASAADAAAAAPAATTASTTTSTRHQWRYRIGMVYVVHKPIDGEQAEMHTWPPADFCGFSLEQGWPTQNIPRATRDVDNLDRATLH